MTDSPFVHSSLSTTDNGIARPAPRVVRPVLSVITRARFDATPRVDAVDVNEAPHWLISSTDPHVVFTHLAQLCTPMLCDVATVENVFQCWRNHASASCGVGRTDNYASDCSRSSKAANWCLAERRHCHR